MNESDGELVDLCRAGDEAAIRRFVTRFQSRIFGLCLRMLGHRHEAEDAVQETLVRAIRYLHNWDGERPLEPWVLMIAANRCRTIRAGWGRRPVASGDALPEQTAPSLKPNDFQEVLDAALWKLRDEYRECFVLYYLQELNIAEVSQSMGVPEGTIKIWLHRARKQLAELLRLQGLEPTP